MHDAGIANGYFRFRYRAIRGGEEDRHGRLCGCEQMRLNVWERGEGGSGAMIE